MQEKFVYTITVAPYVSITAAVRKEFEKKKEYTEARVQKNDGKNFNQKI